MKISLRQLEVYRSLYHFIPDNSAMQMEVEAAIKELDAKMNAKRRAPSRQ